jgi:hypothetical protein
MALSRYVVGTTVTLPAGTPTADANGFGLATWAGTGSGITLQWSAAGSPVTFIRGQVILADSAATSTPTGAMQLYTALQAAGANLRAYVQGSDDVGHAALAN